HAGCMPADRQERTALGQLRVAGVPVEIFFFAAAALLGFLVLRFTKYGRFIYFMGDNFTAARHTGMPVPPMMPAHRVASARIAFFAGLIPAANLASINTRVVNSTL